MKQKDREKTTRALILTCVVCFFDMVKKNVAQKMEFHKTISQNYTRHLFYRYIKQFDKEGELIYFQFY